MKNSPAVEAVLKNDHAVRAIPKLTVDWNMNRYIGATATNIPSDDDEGYDVEMFPIESIIKPIRPTKGINKLRIGQGTIGDDYKANSNSPYNGRFYIADVDDEYKYWTSPYPSNSSGALTSCLPTVIYNQPVEINKIVITTENSWASAENFSIQLQYSAGGSWTTVATQTDLGNGWKASGQIVLYWDGNDWKNSSRVDNEDGSPRTRTVAGVRFQVTSLEGGYMTSPDGSLHQSTYLDTSTSGAGTTRSTTGNNSFFDLIEISARLEADLSQYLISTQDTFDLGDASTLYPIGTITSNVGNITLSNLYELDNGEWVPGLFNNRNEDSPFHNYIDENAEMTLVYDFYDDETDAFLDRIHEFKLFTDSWSGQDGAEVSVSLTDFSKFFNETMVQATMWEGLTVPEIVWRIMDSVGFVDYHIDYDADRVTEHVIPVFYTNGEQTVWEVLDELAQAAQAAIYFDGKGKLNVKTRDFAYSAADAPVWNFTAVTDDDQLSNIQALNVDDQFGPNSYKISYQKSDWQPVQNNPVNTMQKVWTAEDTLVLRATGLYRDMSATDNYFYLSPDDIKTWPYEGMVNIEGELIKYKGKQYVYYTGATGQTRNTKDITSADEFKSRNKQTPAAYRTKNYFTGGLKVVERGMWNSEAKAHNIDVIGYSANKFLNNHESIGESLSGFEHLRAESKVRLNTDSRFETPNDTFTVVRGSANDEYYFNYGTKMRLVSNSAKTHQMAGMMFNVSGQYDNGYYVEITPSAKTSTGGHEEVMLYVKKGSSYKSLVGTGAPAAIGEDIDYEIDISFKIVGGAHKIDVWINGKQMFTATVVGGDQVTPSGRFGLFARGKTQALYEYLYAFRREDSSEMMEDFSFMDKVGSGYIGNYLDREVVYGYINVRRRVKKKWKKVREKHKIQVLDEFGPIVHEIREFNVKFDPVPVLHSRLYMSNDWSAVAMEYSGDPFGAKFIIANTSRHDAIINGDDTISYSGTGDSIPQVLTVFGRALIVDEAEEIIAENSDQVRRRGKNESEITNPWIQSKQMAQDVADWMKSHFSYGNNIMTAQVFGNPLVEVGDVVHVIYPEKHIDGDFFVVSVQNEFDAGLATTLGLFERVVSI